MHPLVKKFLHLMESYIFVLLVSIAIGIIFPKTVAPLGDYTALILAIIFFFSALKLDLKEVRSCLKDIPLLIVTNVFMLVLFPIIIFYVTKVFLPDYAIAFMLLAAMPTAMSAPLIADVVGGRQDIALVLTILTSLLAPFTIPFVIQLLAGSVVTVSFASMFWNLAKIIIVPIGLANIVKPFFKKQILATSYTFKPISVTLLGLLIMGVVGKQSDQIFRAFKGEFLDALIALFVLFAAFHVIGYYTAYWRKRDVRISVSVCLTYMNFTLAIYLAATYFTDSRVLVPVILSVLPWSLMVIPFEVMMKKMRKATRGLGH